jgi:hypothetical protein
MAAARTVSELLWSIFCPFELLGQPAQVKSPIPPSLVTAQNRGKEHHAFFLRPAARPVGEKRPESVGRFRSGLHRSL